MDLNQWILNTGYPEEKADVLVASLEFAELLEADKEMLRLSVAALFRQKSMFQIWVGGSGRRFFSSFDNKIHDYFYSNDTEKPEQVVVKTLTNPNLPGFILFDTNWEKAVQEKDSAGYNHALICFTKSTHNYHSLIESIESPVIWRRGPFARLYMCLRLGWWFEITTYCSSSGILAPHFRYAKSTNTDYELPTKQVCYDSGESK